MCNKMFLMGLGVGLSVLLGSSNASAEKLRGSNYLGASLNIYKWGDPMMDSEFGSTYGGSIFGNYSLTNNWDINIAYAGAWDSANGTDISANVGSLGLDYLFLPDQPINPFIGGYVGFANARIKSGGVTISDTDPAFGAEVGAEWEVCKEAFLEASAFYGYVDTNTSNNNGEYGISLSSGIQLIDHLIVVAGAAYTFEEEDVVLSLGLVVQY